MIFQVPLPKIEKLKRAILSVLDSDRVPLKDLLRIVGNLISVTISLGLIARLFTRYMYFVIACRRSWHDHIVVSEQLAQELMRLMTML